MARYQDVSWTSARCAKPPGRSRIRPWSPVLVGAGKPQVHESLIVQRLAGRQAVHAGVEPLDLGLLARFDPRMPTAGAL